MICKGKTKLGKSCKNKCSKNRKYCYLHTKKRVKKGGNKASNKIKLTPDALKFKPYTIKPKKSKTPIKKKSKTPKKYIPPHLRKKNKSTSPKKSVKKSVKKYVPPGLRKSKSTGRFKPSPPKYQPQCVDYQSVCKSSKYGNVYENRCHPKKSIQYNLGLRDQADKCVKLRIKNRDCRINSGLKATPKHDYAIKKTKKNADECDFIAYQQKNPRRFGNNKVIYRVN